MENYNNTDEFGNNLEELYSNETMMMNSSPFFNFVVTKEPQRAPLTALNVSLLNISMFNNSVTNTTNQTNPHNLFYDIVGVVELSEVTLALILHVSVFSMIMNQKKIRNTKSCKLFLNLQFVHVMLLISKVIHYTYEVYNEMHIYVNNCLLMQLFLAMMLATIDRLVAIKLPYKYGNYRTKHVITGIMFSWLPGVAFITSAIVSSPGKKFMSVLNTILLGFAMIVLVSSNVSIYSIARKQWHDIKTRCTQASFKGFKENKQLKSIYVCLSIVTSFFVFWMPYFVHGVLVLVVGYQDVDIRLTICIELIAFANSATDPILFVMFRKDARKELKRLMKNKKTGFR